MSMARRFPLAIGVGAAALLATAGAAAAEDNLLRGPHPFLKQNELSVHVLLATGGDHTPDGTKLAADYGYHLIGPAWVNLQLNFQHHQCHTPSGGTVCEEPSGSVWETLVGGKLKFATAIPVVPFVKGGVGLAYAFPSGAASGFGPAIRFSGGANYFFFDWLGLGGEIGVSAGHLSTAQSGYSVLDFGGGLEFQF
jgi:hypothetical protein